MSRHALCAYVRLRIGWRARGGLQGAHLAEADDGSCLRPWHTHLSAVVQTDADAIRSCRRPRYVETKRLGLALRAVLCFLFFFPPFALCSPGAHPGRARAGRSVRPETGPAVPQRSLPGKTYKGGEHVDDLALVSFVWVSSQFDHPLHAAECCCTSHCGIEPPSSCRSLSSSWLGSSDLIAEPSLLN